MHDCRRKKKKTEKKKPKYYFNLISEPLFIWWKKIRISFYEANYINLNDIVFSMVHPHVSILLRNVNMNEVDALQKVSYKEITT